MWPLTESTPQVRQNAFDSSRSVKLMPAPKLGEGIPPFGGAVAFCVEQCTQKIVQ
jgi:hypothetical protein